MKKTLFILLIFFFPLQAMAFEDYIIMSDKVVDSVYSSDEDIVSVLPVYTIDNSKNSILLKSKKVGNAVVTISTVDGDKVLKVDVSQDKTALEDVEGLTYFAVDMPQGGK